MRYIAILIGAPLEWNELLKGLIGTKLNVAERIEWLIQPMRYRSAATTRYPQRTASWVIERAYEKLSENFLSCSTLNASVLTLMVDFSDDSTRLVEESIHRFSYIIKLGKPDVAEDDRPMEVQIAGRTFVRNVASSALRGVKALGALATETISHANKTPVLLPLKNFKNEELIDEIRSIPSAALLEPDPGKYLMEFRKRSRTQYCKLRSDSAAEKENVFIDERDLIFSPPGNDRHGIMRELPGQIANLECMLASRLRLGAPYAPNFHYDVTHLHESRLPALRGCDGAATFARGRWRANISPNDHVR